MLYRVSQLHVFQMLLGPRIGEGWQLPGASVVEQAAAAAKAVKKEAEKLNKSTVEEELERAKSISQHPDAVDEVMMIDDR